MMNTQSVFPAILRDPSATAMGLLATWWAGQRARMARGRAERRIQDELAQLSPRARQEIEQLIWHNRA